MLRQPGLYLDVLLTELCYLRNQPEALHATELLDCSCVEFDALQMARNGLLKLCGNRGSLYTVECPMRMLTMASYFPCSLMRLFMLVSNVITECSSTPFSSLEASFLLDSRG